MKKLLFTLLFSTAALACLSAQFISILGLQPRDLVYSKTTGRLYVTLEQMTQFDSIELVVVNPANAVIEDTLYFPGRPMSLAVSTDGQYLFVGSVFPNRVHRIHLGTGVEDLNFALQGDAAPVKIIPSPDDYKKTVIVEGLPAPTLGSNVAFYDESVRRPASIQNTETVIFRDDNTLVGITTSSDNLVVVYQVDATCIHQMAASSVDGYPPHTMLKMVGGRLVMSNGRIYQFNGLYLQYFSWYFNEPFQSGRSFTADPDSAVVYFALDWHQPGSKITLHTYNNNSTSKSVLGIGGLAGSAQQLTDWGGHGRLAFIYAPNTGGLKLVILNPCHSNAPPPVIIPSSPGGCDSDTITLSGPPGAAGYFWSNGSNEMTTRAMYQNTYTLSITGPDGCLTSPSAPVQILTDSRPPKCTFANGSSFERICEGDSLSVMAVAPSGWELDIDHFIWNTGATTQSITVSTAGQYTVSAVTIHGCVGEPSYPFWVEVSPLPAQPFIQHVSNTLVAPFSSGYIWYLDGLPLLAETGYSLTLSDTGVYTLRVLSADGCVSPLSEPFYWGLVVPATEPLPGLSVPQKATRIAVSDIRGILVFDGFVSDFETEKRNLPPGVYAIQWFGDNRVFLGGSKWVHVGE